MWTNGDIQIYYKDSYFPQSKCSALIITAKSICIFFFLLAKGSKLILKFWRDFLQLFCVYFITFFFFLQKCTVQIDCQTFTASSFSTEPWITVLAIMNLLSRLNQTNYILVSWLWSHMTPLLICLCHITDWLKEDLPLCSSVEKVVAIMHINILMIQRCCMWWIYSFLWGRFDPKYLY